MHSVTLFNRSSKELEGVWDGQIVKLPSRKEVSVTADAARALIEQHPVMGTEDPYNGTCEYLIACKEFGDSDRSKIEQTDARERLYRDEGEIEYVPVRRISGKKRTPAGPLGRSSGSVDVEGGEVTSGK